MNPHVVEIGYLVAAGLFILSLTWMSRPSTARRGVIAGEIGMLLAIVGTLVLKQVVNYELIVVALLLGSAIGVPLAYLMPMTAIPQRTALSHAFGALAVSLIGTAEFLKLPGTGPSFVSGALTFEMLLGLLTCTASLVAFCKLQEILPTRPIKFPGQSILNLAIFSTAAVGAVVLALEPQANWLLWIFIALASAFGVLLVMPIGGADMPTVIALLNAYAGIAASAMGFALRNQLLIVTGALDGASGFILALIMCKAMNRSFSNVLFGGLGQVAAPAPGAGQRPVRSTSMEDAALQLEHASRVVVVPGYGMAVAQAQHKVSELYRSLTAKGVEVRFAIHPVAGRMPGHMNVLLAEANVPYDHLVEMDDVNGEMAAIDIALVIGANDVVNPAARDPKSLIGGMPIIDVDHARQVMVIKRGMNPGFAGIDNEIYYLDKTQMLFGDAKDFVSGMAKSLSGANGGH